MSKEESPYIRHCGFCQQGMLRFMRCRECGGVCAICDECELAWDDIPAVSENAKAGSSGSFPKCTACGEASARWKKLDEEEVHLANLDTYVAGVTV